MSNQSNDHSGELQLIHSVVTLVIDQHLKTPSGPTHLGLAGVLHKSSLQKNDCWNFWKHETGRRKIVLVDAISQMTTLGQICFSAGQIPINNYLKQKGFREGVYRHPSGISSGLLTTPVSIVITTRLETRQRGREYTKKEPFVIHST
ncbi:hypothetical protein PAAG_08381 [Paracoccidioides lutzii Pb01]|uniref:Uncharacterized protein n=1 Tax=Paracoccidioides lutzii (strain ATCC MYA-826 / Pb01) TaxID=502779 RepID=C1HC90_PARBA|nr:hypothetical protein PAAG_08381 [Paracoccidioides lutzii Pb01]EEH38654.2 hypothetical protein PAAG_08381 [Paracoccidioides lutzii Pb01]